MFNMYYAKNKKNSIFLSRHLVDNNTPEENLHTSGAWKHFPPNNHAALRTKKTKWKQKNELKITKRNDENNK